MDKNKPSTISLSNFNRKSQVRKAPTDQHVFSGIIAHCKLILEADNAVIEFSLPPDTSQLLIGRASDSMTEQVGLDLTPYNALNTGVSRIHARFERSATHMFVRDLHSSNGTWVNGDRVVPDHVHEIFDGDRIEFGRMAAKFHIQL